MVFTCRQGPEDKPGAKTPQRFPDLFFVLFCQVWIISKLFEIVQCTQEKAFLQQEVALKLSIQIVLDIIDSIDRYRAILQVAGRIRVCTTIIIKRFVQPNDLLCFAQRTKKKGIVSARGC